MRNLYFLKQDALEALRANIGNNLYNYSLSTNDWIYEFFDGMDPFVEFKEKAPDFKLNKHRGGKAEIDVENAKILYINLKDILTPSQASDERFWAGLAHGTFWEYMHNRWEMDKGDVSVEAIEGRYFFKHSIQRSLLTHTISRLWWTAHKMYDESRDNPFELLEYFERDFVTPTLTFFSSNFSNNPILARALVSGVIEIEEINRRVSREDFRELLRYLNINGGISIIDFYEEEELKDILVIKGLEIQQNSYYAKAIAW